ncbi:hypothetical protein LPB72_10965 [Hydrogenophaga crassostreae]|nr:DUF3179 domain-containing (seleno)protein [Hydrogenophaga crassostreae]OAD41819.1 hypothetical protein LPB72_10965 [Hydrogenophaga crassostreae]
MGSVLVVLALLAAASPSTAQPVELKDKAGQAFAMAPVAPSGALKASTTRAVKQAVEALYQRRFPSAAVKAIGASGDTRMGWYLYDLLRFASRSDMPTLVTAFEKLMGANFQNASLSAMGDSLLAWNLPAPPGYTQMKQDLFLLIEPRWAPFFADTASTIDWRWVGWGGVFIDDRPDATRGQGCPGGCIPALDQPKTTPASEGGWYPDNATVFGVVINGEARAYPKNIMEVHEMVNDTLGGRQIALPYCTLCRAAQAYFTDRTPGFKPLLRTSGLLSRSNKFMYDLSTWSAVDTSTGEALSGPLRKAQITLPQTTVVTSTWGAWRKAHPQSTIVAQDGGIGRTYPLDPLRGRDNNGPIFPVGDVDPRLPVHEVVLGVTSPKGKPLAFPRAAAQMALKAGEPVTMDGIVVRNSGDGLRAFVAEKEAVSHEAFWFAWSQFKPGTLLWERAR